MSTQFFGEGRTMETKIGRNHVPVRGNWATLVPFAAGAHGKKEAGVFAFWTAVIGPVKLDGKTRKRIFGRAKVGLSAGDRFDRMRFEMKSARDADDRRIYRRFWYLLLRKGANVRYVRPSTLKEVRAWMKSHQADARHAARRISLGGKQVRR
jgi:hypothetical protein